MRTLQEIFNIGYLGMKSQGFQKSINLSAITTFCCYRSYSGNKCLIGHCIADEDYQELQSCHDLSYSPKDMVQRLRSFAITHNLVIPSEAA